MGFRARVWICGKDAPAHFRGPEIKLVEAEKGLSPSRIVQNLWEWGSALPGLESDLGFGACTRPLIN